MNRESRRVAARDAKASAVKAAMGLAADISAGRVSPEALDREVADEVRKLAGTVVGRDDPVWPLQSKICRGVLAAGGVPARELAEWTAVQRAAEAWHNGALIEGEESQVDDDAQGVVTAAEALTRRSVEYQERLRNVSGPEDPLWPVVVDIARQVVAKGGIPSAEIAKAIERQGGTEVDDDDADEARP